jgi:Flp pilus assembly protein TadG
MLSRFSRDRRGTAAVEFAFVAPLMILLYYGLAELTQGMMADRRASHVASIIGDLVAQDTQVNTTEMNDVFNVGKALVAPFPTSTLSMRITSVTADATGKATVAWSKVSGTAYPVLSGTVTGLPAGVLEPNGSVIISEATYVYSSSIRQVIPGGITFVQKFHLKPRHGTPVLWSTS